MHIKIKVNIREIDKIINKMDLVFLQLNKGMNIRDYLLMVSVMGKERKFIRIKKVMKDCLKRGKNKDKE